MPPAGTVDDVCNAVHLPSMPPYSYSHILRGPVGVVRRLLPSYLRCWARNPCVRLQWFFLRKGLRMSFLLAAAGSKFRRPGGARDEPESSSRFSTRASRRRHPKSHDNTHQQGGDGCCRPWQGSAGNWSRKQPNKIVRAPRPKRRLSFWLPRFASQL